MREHDQWESIAQRSRRPQRGDLGLRAKLLPGDASGLDARNTRKGKASHRGHRGHRGGLGVAGEIATGDASGLDARNTRKGKASHRGHRGHRGDWGLRAKLLPVTHLAWMRETRARGKHRTEVTEATEGDWGLGRNFHRGYRWHRREKQAFSILSHRSRSRMFAQSEKMSPLSNRFCFR